MIFAKQLLGCPPFLGYVCWPKVVGALLLLSAPLALLSFWRPWLCSSYDEMKLEENNVTQWHEYYQEFATSNRKL